MESSNVETQNQSEMSLGLCLSGGGALGFAHIGVLQALLENGIEPEIISGSSMGAIVGTLYAAGISPDEMLKIIKEGRIYHVSRLLTLKPGFWKSGWSNHSTVLSLVKEVIPHNSFEKLQKKMFICVTNLNTAQWEIKSTGKRLNAWVSASASIPGVFEAYEYNNIFYVDGGLLNNMPAQPLRDTCHTIIGVDVLPYSVPLDLKKPLDTIIQSIRGVQSMNSTKGRSLCKYIIEPQVLNHFNEFRFDAYQRIYEQGYQDTLDYIKKNPEILNLRN